MSDTEKEDVFSYTSTEVSQFYGMTIKGMEYYENRGLVHPERIGNSKIRRYSLLDSYRLYFTKMMKNMGVSLPETMEILENNTCAQTQEAFDTHILAIRSNLARQQRMLENMEHVRNMLSIIESGDMPFRIVSEDGFYRLYLRHLTGPHDTSSENTIEYRSWNDYLPITNASLRIPLRDCAQVQEKIETQVGMIIRKSDFHALGLKESERTEYIPAGRFLYTIIYDDWKVLGSQNWLRPAMTYMQDHGLRQTGDAFTRMIFVLKDENGNEVRYDEAWFPIEESL